jgi:anti-sigma factor RsiW
MMNERLSPEIEDLHAYVDGQLGPDTRRRVVERLAADPQAQRRADDYAAIRDGLRALYGPVADQPVPARLLRRPAYRQWYRPLAAMAASIALLVLGGWVGMQLQGSHPAAVAGVPSVVREAAMAYAVYTPEVRHPVEVPGDQEQHLVAWLSKRMGVPYRAPRLDDLGFALVGGRLLSSDDGPGALLMYEDAQGRRVVLYACHNEHKDRETALRFAQAEGISVFHWLEGPLSYALAGEIDRAALQALTEAAHRQVST